MPSAVDTNVLVRFLADDGCVHVEHARRLFEKERIFISLTVMLETEWVLRSSFGFQRSQICDAFERVLGLGSAKFQEPQALENALDAYRSGMDFADALHLSTATGCDVFYTFDKNLIRKAEQEFPAVSAREP